MLLHGKPEFWLRFAYLPPEGLGEHCDERVDGIGDGVENRADVASADSRAADSTLVWSPVLVAESTPLPPGDFGGG